MQPVPSSEPVLQPAPGEAPAGASRTLLAAFIDRVVGVSAIGACMQPAEYQRVVSFLYPQGGPAAVPETAVPATLPQRSPAETAVPAVAAAATSLVALAPLPGNSHEDAAAPAALPPMSPEEAANVPVEDMAIPAGPAFAPETDSARLVRWPLELPDFAPEPAAAHPGRLAAAPVAAAQAAPEAAEVMPEAVQVVPEAVQAVDPDLAAVPEPPQSPAAADIQQPEPRPVVLPATPVPARDAAAMARERERQAWSGALHRSAPAAVSAGRFMNEGAKLDNALDWIAQKPAVSQPAAPAAAAVPRPARHIFPRVALPMTAEIRGEQYPVSDWSASAFTLENAGPLGFAGELFSARLSFALGQVKTAVVAGCRAVAFESGMARSFQIIDLDPQDAQQLRRLGDLWRSGKEPGAEFFPAPAPQAAVPGLASAIAPAPAGPAAWTASPFEGPMSNGLAPGSALPGGYAAPLPQGGFSIVPPLQGGISAPSRQGGISIAPPQDAPRFAAPRRRRGGAFAALSRFLSLLLLAGVVLIGFALFWAGMAASVPAVQSVAAAVSGRAVPVVAPADGIVVLGALAAGHQVAGGDSIARIAGPDVPVVSPCTCSVMELTVAEGTQVLAGRTLAILGLMPKDTVDVDALFATGEEGVKEGQVAAVRFEGAAGDVAAMVVAVSPDAVDITRTGLVPKPGLRGVVRATVSVPRGLAPAGVALGAPATVSVRGAAAWHIGKILGFDVDAALAALWQRVHGQGKG